MRIIGLDWGASRIGVSVSDPLNITALPLQFIKNESSVLTSLLDLIKKYSAEMIVLGLPKQMDGKAGISAVKVKEFYDSLKDKLPVEMILWDERLTTKMAQRAYHEMGTSSKASRGLIDSTSAAMMLQSYMDSQKACEKK